MPCTATTRPRPAPADPRPTHLDRLDRFCRQGAFRNRTNLNTHSQNPTAAISMAGVNNCRRSVTNTCRTRKMPDPQGRQDHGRALADAGRCLRNTHSHLSATPSDTCVSTVTRALTLPWNSLINVELALCPDLPLKRGCDGSPLQNSHGLYF